MTNLPLCIIFDISTSPTQRTAHVEDVPDIEVVVGVRDTLTGRRTIIVEAVETSTSDIARTTEAIHEWGLEIERRTF